MASSTSPSMKQIPAWVEVLAECLPRVDDLVTEDDTPVDHLFSAKQQRAERLAAQLRALGVEPL